MTCPRAGSAEYAAYYAKMAGRRSAGKKTTACLRPGCGRKAALLHTHTRDGILERYGYCSGTCVELDAQRRNEERKNARTA
jgi:hypothetical protein